MQSRGELDPYKASLVNLASVLTIIASARESQNTSLPPLLGCSDTAISKDVINSEKKLWRERFRLRISYNLAPQVCTAGRSGNLDLKLGEPAGIARSPGLWEPAHDELAFRSSTPQIVWREGLLLRCDPSWRGLQRSLLGSSRVHARTVGSAVGSWKGRSVAATALLGAGGETACRGRIGIGACVIAGPARKSERAVF